MSRISKRSTADSSAVMRAVRSSGTEPELRVREALVARGLAFELDNHDLPGKPDIVFKDQLVAVFVDGDFWHGSQWRLRGLSRLEDQFTTNAEYWIRKIRRNMERDEAVTNQLEKGGWTVMRFLESEVRNDVDVVASAIAAAIGRTASR